ncbi:MAG: T9SS type A sorting domain-containing protein [Bacteroidetes bacterium]|nr:T9SS type A sorting domain-containing protein [Bacteroidota bacterium]
MKSILSILTALVFAVKFSGAQEKEVILKINHKLNENAFALASTAKNNNNEKFNLSRLEYYVSSVMLIDNDDIEIAAKDVYLLVNGNQSDYSLGSYELAGIKQIKFSVGVNTPENNADPAQWPNDHALSPKSPSMHWGWSAGYRFVAMEGKSGSLLDKTFECHALGNDFYFQVTLDATAEEVDGKMQIEINADYARALENISLESGFITHGSFGEAVTVLTNFRDYVFSNLEGKGNTASINEGTSLKIDMFPNPSNGVVQIQLENKAQESALTIQVLDATGKAVMQQNMNANSVEIGDLKQGFYFISVFNNQGILAREKLLVL